MLIKINTYIGFILLLINNLSFAQSGISYDNMIYDDNIRTVMLYPQGSQKVNFVQSPVITLRGPQRLVLEYDELYNDAYNYQAKLIHCNAKWQPSGLSPLQYLEDYNEFPINDSEYSFGTITPYVHYRFVVPRPKLPGNYLLVVYAEGDPDDVIITRRFLVYEQWVTLSSPQEIMSRSIYTQGKQGLQFDVHYNNVNLENPQENISVNILQNTRWDNAKMNIKTTFVKELDKTLEFNHFSTEDAFYAANEFRTFDIRSLKYFGFHVDAVKFLKDKVLVSVEEDKPRAGLAYTILETQKGQFEIENLERKIPEIENDYAMVYFRLASEELGKKVYLSGSFTDWVQDESTEMHYNAALDVYERAYKLKQGRYDYQYLVEGKVPYSIEGSKEETRNLYEIFVYYYSQKYMTDLLIGYQRFIFNGW